MFQFQVKVKFLKMKESQCKKFFNFCFSLQMVDTSTKIELDLAY